MGMELIGGHYEFDRQTNLIGRGGMGMVYRGRDTQTDKWVAIKQLNFEMASLSADYITRFMREADVLRDLSHPNIVAVYDAISAPQAGHYLVMEYVGGGSLWDELQGAPQLSIQRTLDIGTQLASALMVVHKKGIVHRDIKPANVLVADDKSVRLSDFGVVHISNITRMTVTGGVVGTLDYLSPEALNGDIITPASDIWAFGAMLYELLAGVRPFEGDNLSALVSCILTKPHPPLSQYRADLPYDLTALIDAMLMKNPDERVSDMSIIHQTLSQISKGEAVTAQYYMRERLDSVIAILTQRVGAPFQNFADVPFYDRDHQRAEIANLISDGKPFIGVYGRGGIGKTALVSKVLTDTEGVGMVDGVAYVRANSTPRLNINELFDTLGQFLDPDNPFNKVKKDPSVSVADKTASLIQALARGNYLLCIDNLETLQHPDTHVLIDDDIQQFLETLLTKRSPSLTTVITSRYPIPFSNTTKPYETIVRLDEGLPHAEAVEFLRGIDKKGVLPADDAQLHLWIDKVGGYPRGLEALVGYLNGGETREIEDLLTDAPLFEGEVLSNIVQHAHDALPADFRQVLAGVAVIGQATTRAELEYLLTPFVNSSRLRFMLERLVEGRFLTYNRQTRTYSLHPIDLAYALSITQKGGADDDETAFTQYHLHRRMAAYWVSQRKPRADWKSLADIQPQLREIEHDYAVEDYDAVIKILGQDVSGFLEQWGALELCQAHHVRLRGKIKDTFFIGYNLNRLARMAERFYHIDESKALYSEMLNQAQETGHKKNQGRAFIGLGNIDFYQSKYESAIPHFEQALPLAHEAKSVTDEMVCLANLATAYRLLSQFDQALAYYEAVIPLHIEAKNALRQATTIYYLGSLYIEMGEFDKALDHLLRGLAMIQQLNRLEEQFWILQEMARLYMARGQFTEAIAILDQALPIVESLKIPIYIFDRRLALSRIHFLAGDIANAKHAMQTAREYDQITSRRDTMLMLDGMIAIREKRMTDVLPHLTEALGLIDAILVESPNAYERLYNRALVLAGLWLAGGDSTRHDQAREAAERAKAVCGYAGVMSQYRQLLDAMLVGSNQDARGLRAVWGGEVI